ncbi:MAG: adenylyl-sulfate kinase [Acidobacteria bacterium]|nr:MAG: adenylyl-sulfate kinase [Acidobacteriota bacterium]
MKLVGLTQRIDADARGERRDALERRWHRFLARCGLAGVPLPNDAAAAEALLDRLPLAGIILTGGNDLAGAGGDAPERDALERILIERAERERWPVLGVCRGLQLIAVHHGARIERVAGHAGTRHLLDGHGVPAEVNSYHDWGVLESPPQLLVRARSPDGVIEAIETRDGRLAAIQWHPEREPSPAAADRHLLDSLFGGPGRPGASEGTVYWITGLSGAGKTTLGRALVDRLRAAGRPALLLDGDSLREAIAADLGHDMADRHRSAMRNARLCRLLASQGADVVCCTISMFEDVRSWNRDHIPRYREIYLRASLALLEARDPKGIYAAARRGEIRHVWGVDLPWEEPRRPDLVIDVEDRFDPDTLAGHILGELR